MQESLSYPRVWGSVGAVLSTQTTLHEKMQEMQEAFWVLGAFIRAMDTWQEGATPRGCMEPAASSSQPGCVGAVGSSHRQTLLQGCSSQPQAAGWGDMLEPMHSWTVLLEGRHQERNREKWNSHLTFERMEWMEGEKVWLSLYIKKSL